MLTFKDYKEILNYEMERRAALPVAELEDRAEDGYLSNDTPYELITRWLEKYAVEDLSMDKWVHGDRGPEHEGAHVKPLGVHGGKPRYYLKARDREDKSADPICFYSGRGFWSNTQGARVYKQKDKDAEDMVLEDVARESHEAINNLEFILI